MKISAEFWEYLQHQFNELGVTVFAGKKVIQTTRAFYVGFDLKYDIPLEKIERGRLYHFTEVLKDYLKSNRSDEMSQDLLRSSIKELVNK